MRSPSWVARFWQARRRGKWNGAPTCPLCALRPPYDAVVAPAAVGPLTQLPRLPEIAERLKEFSRCATSRSRKTCSPTRCGIVSTLARRPWAPQDTLTEAKLAFLVARPPHRATTACTPPSSSRSSPRRNCGTSARSDEDSRRLAHLGAHDRRLDGAAVLGPVPVATRSALEGMCASLGSSLAARQLAWPQGPLRRSSTTSRSGA